MKHNFYGILASIATVLFGFWLALTAAGTGFEKFKWLIAVAVLGVLVVYVGDRC